MIQDPRYLGFVDKIDWCIAEIMRLRPTVYGLQQNGSGGGGGGSIAIGSPISGATPQNGLYTDDDGKLADGAGMPIQVKVNQDDGTWTMGDLDGGLSGATLYYSAENGTLAFDGEFTTGGAINANGGLTWNKAANTNTLPSGRAAAGEVPIGVGDGSMVWVGLPVVANLSIVGVNNRATYTVAHGQSFTPTTVLLIGANSDCLLLGNYFIGTVDGTNVTFTFTTVTVGTPTYNFKAVYFR